MVIILPFLSDTMNLYIKVGSITNAQRAKSVLMKYSVKAQVQRAEQIKQGDGCGYIIKVYDDDENKILNILKNNGINSLGVEIK